MQEASTQLRHHFHIAQHGTEHSTAGHTLGTTMMMPPATPDLAGTPVELHHSPEYPFMPQDSISVITGCTEE